MMVNLTSDAMMMPEPAKPVMMVGPQGEKGPSGRGRGTRR